MTALSDPTIRSIFENLTRAIFPLGDWLAQRGPGGYVPPYPDLPWRKPGAQLSIDDLKVADFFERLLTDNSDTALAARWNKLIADPPQFPKAGSTEWRLARGLKAAPKFGILDSDNFVAFSKGADGTKIAMTRLQFYQAIWPALNDVVLTVKPQSPQDWSTLVDKLRTNDAKIKWPRPPVPVASDFIRQFTGDCLYALLNFSNPLPAPWNAAVPIEVGEFRRPKQKVSAKAAAEAVQAFVEKT